MGALPPDRHPGPPEQTRQAAYCTQVNVLSNTDFKKQPGYMDPLNLTEAWRISRGRGVKVAVIDTGVQPHSRLPRLTGGGDYVSSRAVTVSRTVTRTAPSWPR